MHEPLSVVLLLTGPCPAVYNALLLGSPCLNHQVSVVAQPSVPLTTSALTHALVQDVSVHSGLELVL